MLFFSLLLLLLPLLYAPWMRVAYLLDVVVGQSAAVLQLLTSEDQALLVRRDTLLVLDLRLNIVDGVRGLDLKGDGLPRQGLDEAVGVSLVLSSHIVRRSIWRLTSALKAQHVSKYPSEEQSGASDHILLAASTSSCRCCSDSKSSFKWGANEVQHVCPKSLSDALARIAVDWVTCLHSTTAKSVAHEVRAGYGDLRASRSVGAIKS